MKNSEPAEDSLLATSSWEDALKDMCSDSSCDDASDAMVINALAEELALEKGCLQSYHDACFAKFIEQNPCDELHSMKQRKKEYMHEQYNFNTRRLLQRRLLQTRRMPQSMKTNKFLPMVSVTLPNGEINMERAQIVASVSSDDLPIFERLFFERWSKVETALKYSTTSIEDAFFSFTDTEYYSILKYVQE